jgi:hypothetical protein
MLYNFVTQNADTILQFRPWLLLYIFFPIHYLLIVLFVTLGSQKYSQYHFIAHEQIQHQISKICTVGINVSIGAGIFAKFWTDSGSHPDTHSMGTVSKLQENEYAFVPPYPNQRLRGVLPPIQLLFTHRWTSYFSLITGHGEVLLCIMEVLSSNLGPRDGYSQWCIMCFMQSLKAKCHDNTWKYTTAFFHTPSNSLFTNHSLIRRFTN